MLNSRLWGGPPGWDLPVMFDDAVDFVSDTVNDLTGQTSTTGGGGIISETLVPLGLTALEVGTDIVQTEIQNNEIRKEARRFDRAQQRRAAEVRRQARERQNQIRRTAARVQAVARARTAAAGFEQVGSPVLVQREIQEEGREAVRRLRDTTEVTVRELLFVGDQARRQARRGTKLTSIFSGTRGALRLAGASIGGR